MVMISLLQDELPLRTFEEAVMDPWTGIDMTDAERFIAGLILEATTAEPIKQADIITAVRREKQCSVTERQVRHIVRNLRRMHKFPICTRKGKPPGYWWARTEAEMKEFVETWEAQYKDEAQTLSLMLKANFPRLAGQMRLALED